jgi:hypothetical protein
MMPAPHRLSPAGLVLVGAAALVGGCDGGTRVPDARAQQSAYSSELSVRFETGADKATTVSVLGFSAAAAGTEDADVLGMVDPLAAEAPDQGCVLRDADVAARVLGGRGGAIDLQELPGVGVELPAPEALLNPFPRVYPDVAGVVSGVVAEAARPLASIPDRISLRLSGAELPIAELAVPTLPTLLSINGAAPAPGGRVDAADGLTVTLGEPAGALVELRPFGATVAISCTVPSNASTEASLTVPRSLLAHLSPGGAALPVSIEVARRLRTRTPLVTPETRVSVEVRSTMAVELHP